MTSNDLANRIKAATDAIWLVDTHEHTVPESIRDSARLDFFSLFPHYASSDLISAGMPPDEMDRLRDTSLSLEERWATFEPHWHSIRSTGYGRSIRIACSDLFGAEPRDLQGILAISDRIGATSKPGWFRTVLRDRARIAVSIVDVQTTDVDKDLMAPSIRFDQFITARSRMDLFALERATDISIHSLAGLLKALDGAFQRALDEGMIAVKSGLAYQRVLHYDKVSFHEAETLFDRIASPTVPRRELAFPVPGFGLSYSEAKPLQDFMMHQVIRRAIDAAIPIQIHTGMQEGNGNVLDNSRPTHLTNILLEYPEARFDLFHAGYPYTAEMAVLAKNFANVYPDMCWMYIISPEASRRTLHEWIETVPANKILGFGGDYRIVEGSYAHAKMARAVVARVIREKIEDGWIDECEGIELADGILRKNAMTLFKLESYDRS